MTILTQIVAVGIVGALFFLLLMLVRAGARQFRSARHGSGDGSAAVYGYSAFSAFSGGDGGGGNCGDGGSGGDGGGGCGGGE